MSPRLFGLALAVTSVGVSAQATPVTHTFVPPHPTTSDLVRLRTDVQECYSSFGSVTVLLDEPAIEVRFTGSDIECETDVPANMQSPRFADVGFLPAGIYSTRIYSCGFGPMGTACDVIQSGSLIVQDISSARFTVPTLSGVVTIGLAFAVMLVGALMSRTR